MREVKFRYYLENHKTGLSAHADLTLDTLQSVGSGFSNEVGIVARCQFTGLKDRRGEEIYEGDIVRADLYKVERVFAIEWKSIADHSSFGAGTHNLTVIGNIYENPDLLQKTP